MPEQRRQTPPDVSEDVARQVEFSLWLTKRGATVWGPQTALAGSDDNGHCERYAPPMTDIPRLISSETVYAGKLFRVELDHLQMPNGVMTARETLRHPGAVCMVPVDADGRLLMVTQYRHAAGRRLLELPAGTLEPGEEPIATVARELQEEVGRLPASIEPLGGFFVAPGYTSEYIHLFVCTCLSESRLDGDEDEDIEVESVSVEDALAAIESGRICDAKSVIGILRWLRFSNR